MVDYPEAKSEKQMLLNSQGNSTSRRLDLAKLKPIANVEQVLEARQEVRAIKIADNVVDYVLNLVQKSRKHPDLALGASPRSGVAWLQASKAYAWLNNREFVTPDDVKAVAVPLLRHRLILKAESMLDGVQIEGVVKGLLNAVAVPR